MYVYWVSDKFVRHFQNDTLLKNMLLIVSDLPLLAAARAASQADGSCDIWKRMFTPKSAITMGMSRNYHKMPHPLTTRCTHLAPAV